MTRRRGATYRMGFSRELSAWTYLLSYLLLACAQFFSFSRLRKVRKNLTTHFVAQQYFDFNGATVDDEDFFHMSSASAQQSYLPEYEDENYLKNTNLYTVYEGSSSYDPSTFNLDDESDVDPTKWDFTDESSTDSDSSKYLVSSTTSTYTMATSTTATRATTTTTTTTTRTTTTTTTTTASTTTIATTTSKPPNIVTEVEQEIDEPEIDDPYYDDSCKCTLNTSSSSVTSCDCGSENEPQEPPEEKPESEEESDESGSASDLDSSSSGELVCDPNALDCDSGGDALSSSSSDSGSGSAPTEDCDFGDCSSGGSSSSEDYSLPPCTNCQPETTTTTIPPTTAAATEAATTAASPNWVTEIICYTENVTDITEQPEPTQLPEIDEDMTTPFLDCDSCGEFGNECPPDCQRNATEVPEVTSVPVVTTSISCDCSKPDCPEDCDCPTESPETTTGPITTEENELVTLLPTEAPEVSTSVVCDCSDPDCPQECDCPDSTTAVPEVTTPNCDCSNPECPEECGCPTEQIPTTIPETTSAPDCDCSDPEGCADDCNCPEASTAPPLAELTEPELDGSADDEEPENCVTEWSPWSECTCDKEPPTTTRQRDCLCDIDDDENVCDDLIEEATCDDLCPEPTTTNVSKDASAT